MNAESPSAWGQPERRGMLPSDQAIRVLREEYDRDVSRYDEPYLTRTLEKRRQATASESVEAYLDRLATDAAEAESLWRALRVTYSDFFRDPIAFAWLAQLILPGLLGKEGRPGRGEIRIWSAACATGQEPWSVAILLEELAGAPDKRVPYRIFATDISAPDLAQARAGLYSAAALGNVRLRHLDRCFCRQGDGYAIAPHVRARVEFSLYDLLDENTTCPPASIYGDFDVVLCCNVLFYYRPEAQRFILDKPRRCLAPGGYLLVGEAERQIVENVDSFRPVMPPAAVFQKR